MAAGNYDFTIEQGATFSLPFLWKDGAGVPVDLSGRAARMQIRASVASETVLLELTTENGGITLGGVNGTITLNITAAQTAALLRGGVYDLEIITGPVVTRLIQGSVSISKEVTRGAP